MKAFDIQKALDGADVITRDGREVYQLTWFDCANKHCVHGVIDNWIFTWTIEGKFMGNGDEHDKDLFMSPAVHHRWVPQYGDEFTVGYDSIESAKQKHPDAVGFKMVSWEE